MQKIWHKIINTRSNPLYWPVLFVLWIISVAYRLGRSVVLMLNNPTVRTRAAVISVGNLTVGGTGKTPMVIALGKHLIESGKRVGVVSSGYGRRFEKDIMGAGSELVSGSVLDLGDEVLVLAFELPEAYFSVSKSKSEAARMLDEKHDLDVILVDDGYQHIRLHRDFNILLMEAGLDLRKESVFPLGTLREGLDAADRADAIIFTKSNFGSVADGFSRRVEEQYGDKVIAGVEYYNENAVSKAEKMAVDDLADNKIYFFAGIGGYASLLDHLQGRFSNIVGHRQFSDHCSYRPADAAAIMSDIGRFEPEYVVTTYKDYVKLRSFDFGQPLYYLDLKLNFTSGYDRLCHAIEKMVEE